MKKNKLTIGILLAMVLVLSASLLYLLAEKSEQPVSQETGSSAYEPPNVYPDTNPRVERSLVKTGKDSVEVWVLSNNRVYSYGETVLITIKVVHRGDEPVELVYQALEGGPRCAFTCTLSNGEYELFNIDTHEWVEAGAREGWAWQEKVLSIPAAPEKMRSTYWETIRLSQFRVDSADPGIPIMGEPPAGKYEGTVDFKIVTDEGAKDVSIPFSVVFEDKPSDFALGAWIDEDGKDLFFYEGAYGSKND